MPFPSQKGGMGVEMRGPVCWAKMVHFWKPWKHASWPPPECREPFSMLPRHTLSSLMVWNAGAGPWWAATAEIFKIYKSLISPSEHRLLRQTTPDERYNKTQDKHIIVYIFNRAQQNNCDPKRFSGCRLIKTRTFSLTKGGTKPDLHPRPPDLHQNVPNIIANTPGKLLAPEGSFWKSTF